MVNDVTERLITLREKLKVRQGVFAKTIGVPQSTYSSIERGVRPLHNRHIKLICLTFNVNETWLRTGEGEIFTVEDPDTEEFLKVYRALPLSLRKMFLEYGHFLLEKQALLSLAAEPPATP
jgi:transcriptional regulator with XRE-family HTH domain